MMLLDDKDMAVWGYLVQGGIKAALRYVDGLLRPGH